MGEQGEAGNAIKLYTKIIDKCLTRVIIVRLSKCFKKAEFYNIFLWFTIFINYFTVLNLYINLNKKSL